MSPVPSMTFLPFLLNMYIVSYICIIQWNYIWGMFMIKRWIPTSLSYAFLLLLFSRSVVSNSFWPQGLQPTSLLCAWDFPGKSTGVGCHCLLRYSKVNSTKEEHVLNVYKTYFLEHHSKDSYEIYEAHNLLIFIWKNGSPSSKGHEHTLKT